MNIEAGEIKLIYNISIHHRLFIISITFTIHSCAINIVDKLII